MMLAQTVVDIPLTDTMKTVVGLLGVITLAIGVMTFVILAKKLFGRKPSIGKEMSENAKALRSEIYQATGSAKKELNARYYALEKRVDAQENRIEEILLSNAREWKAVRGELSEIRETLAFIRGRFEKRDHTQQ